MGYRRHIGRRRGCKNRVYYLVVGLDIQLNLLASERAHSNTAVSTKSPSSDTKHKAYLICILSICVSLFAHYYVPFCDAEARVRFRAGAKLQNRFNGSGKLLR